MARSMTILNIDEYGQQKVWKYGLDRVYDEFNDVLGIHNKRLATMYSTLIAKKTTDRRWRFGVAGSALKMVKVGRETGRANSRMTNFRPYEIGAPLDKYELSQAWTKRYAERETVERMNAQLSAALTADAKLYQWQIGAALFDNVNFDYYDEEGDGQVYPVKRLLNADSLPIPVGPHGDVFDETTHNHYMVIAAINDANMKLVSTNLTQHSESGQEIVYVAFENAAAYQGLTDFVAAEDSRIIRSVNRDSLGMNSDLDRLHIRNRFLGIVKGGAEYHTRSWIPAGYGFSCIEGGELDAPLFEAYDELDGQGLMVAEPERINSKQEARIVARINGIGCGERRNGVVFKVDAGLGAYTAPSIYLTAGQP